MGRSRAGWGKVRSSAGRTGDGSGRTVESKGESGWNGRESEKEDGLHSGG